MLCAITRNRLPKLYNDHSNYPALLYIDPQTQYAF